MTKREVIDNRLQRAVRKRPILGGRLRVRSGHKKGVNNFPNRKYSAPTKLRVFG
jgi:hypothetical protein